MFYYIRSAEKIDETSTDDHIDHELGMRQIAQQIVKTASRWIKELSDEDQMSSSEPVLVEHFAILDLLPPIFSSAIQDEVRVHPGGEDKQMATDWIAGLLDMMVCWSLWLCVECSYNSCLRVVGVANCMQIIM